MFTYKCIDPQHWGQSTSLSVHTNTSSSLKHRQPTGTGQNSVWPPSVSTRLSVCWSICQQRYAKKQILREIGEKTRTGKGPLHDGSSDDNKETVFLYFRVKNENTFSETGSETYSWQPDSSLLIEWPSTSYTGSLYTTECCIMWIHIYGVSRSEAQCETLESDCRENSGGSTWAFTAHLFSNVLGKVTAPFPPQRNKPEYIQDIKYTGGDLTIHSFCLMEELLENANEDDLQQGHPSFHSKTSAQKINQSINQILFV